VSGEGTQKGKDPEQKDRDLELNEETIEDLEAKQEDTEDVKGGSRPRGGGGGATWSQAWTGSCNCSGKAR
jgi:hypothetical protein